MPNELDNKRKKNDESNNASNNSSNGKIKKKRKQNVELSPPSPALQLQKTNKKMKGNKDKKKIIEVETAEIDDQLQENTEIISGKKNKKGKKDKKKNREVEEEQKMEIGGEKKNKKGKGKRVITDPRFASVHFDPRFQRMPKRESKVEIDDRFSRMLSDKDFAMSAAPVDIRGKRKKKAENPLLHYYLQQEDGEERRGFSKRKGDVAEVKVDRDEDEESNESESVSGDEEEEEERGFDDSDFSDDSDDEEDSEDDDQQSVNSDIARYLMAQHENTPMTDEETHRLAVVNLDWDHIKAVDIYVVMSSCLPRAGQILSVAIYPSEYGKKCMDIESVHGPSGLLNDHEEHSEDDSDIANENFRSYELNKLRYYYAVAVFDSSATAGYVYNTLDGTELLKTSNVFDLRFIPDSMEFQYPPREITTEAPTNYKEPDFHTKALQHSKVTLTWEEDQPERKKILRRKFNPNQLDELNEYLASSTDSDDVDEENGDDESENEDIPLQTGTAKKQKKAEKFRSLLQSTNDPDLDGSGSDDKDMEITFNTELEDLSKRIVEKKDKASETVWEAVLRKRREKKKAGKNRSKDSDDDDSSDYSAQDVADEGDDFFIEEPSESEQKVDKKRNKDLPKNKNNSKKKNKDQTTDRMEKEASKSELELLFADEETADKALKGYNLKPKKVKGKKGKKEEVIEEDKLPNIDVSDDPRFSALFSSHLYALDPTDPQYKRSGAYIREKHHKKKKGSREMNTIAEISDEAEQDSFARPSKSDNDFSLTVRSLKKSVEARNQSKNKQ